MPLTVGLFVGQIHPKLNPGLFGGTHSNSTELISAKKLLIALVKGNKDTVLRREPCSEQALGHCWHIVQCIAQLGRFKLSWMLLLGGSTPPRMWMIASLIGHLFE